MTTIILSETEKSTLANQILASNQGLSGDNLPVLAKAIDIISYAETSASIAEVAGLLSKSTAAASAASTLAFLSALLMPVGTMISIVNALQSSQRHYGMRAFSYTVTAWSFNDPIPQKSERIILNLKSGWPRRQESEMQAYHDAWRKASSHAMKSINQTLAHHQTSKSNLQVLYRALGNDDRTELCLRILQGFESQVSPITRNIWKSNYSILYPR